MFGIRLNVGHKCSIPLKQSDTIRIHPTKINADPYVFGPSRSGSVIICTDPDGSFQQQTKKVRKTLKINVSVPS
jgi:hypothetical protein